jgi:hypothetical protein
MAAVSAGGLTTAVTVGVTTGAICTTGVFWMGRGSISNTPSRYVTA